MAALAVLGIMTIGCGNEDSAVNTLQPSESNSVTLTTTISLGGGTETRALDAAGHKTFAAGDRVAIIYENTNNETVKAVSDALTGIGTDISANGKTATITVSLTNPQAGGFLKYVYPAAAAVATTQGWKDSDLNTLQDGTLETLASKFDICTYQGDLSASAGLPASVTLTNQLAIGEFSVIDQASGNDVTSTITRFEVCVQYSGGNPFYKFDRTATAGPIYVAMLPFSNGSVEFYAYAGSNFYTKTVTGKTFQAGNMYPVNVSMPRRVDLSGKTADYTASDGEVLTCSGSFFNYSVIVPDGATITLDEVDIRSSTGPGIECQGDATIILSDESVNTVKGNNNYPGIHPSRILKPYRLSEVTIEGSGELQVEGGQGAAGIGGGNQGWGNIRITGGTIDATGGSDGAGIGASKNSNNLDCGSIMISGGNVTARGKGCGAGIGSSLHNCNAILISGGTVKAYGGTSSPGIGSGQSGSCSARIHFGERDNISVNAAINITGGQIEAYGGWGSGTSGAPGIGSGANGTCGGIAITSGVTSLKATAGYGCNEPIGKASSSSSCGDITIGGTITWVFPDDFLPTGSFTHTGGTAWPASPSSGSTYGGYTFTTSTEKDSNNRDVSVWTLTP